MRYFWPRMCTDIIKWVKAGEIFAQNKRSKLSITAQITPMPSSDPFERISADILGPLQLCTNSKKQYVLVFVDIFCLYPYVSSKSIVLFQKRNICLGA